MSNINPPFQNLSVDPVEMIVISEAYDLACRTLQNIGQLEVDREIVAPKNLASRKNWRAKCQRVMRAGHPRIDRFRLPATRRVMRPSAGILWGHLRPNRPPTTPPINPPGPPPLR